MNPDQPRRRPGPRGPSPLSAATRRRLLTELLRRAEAGDDAAAFALVRLSLEAARRGDIKPGTEKG